MRDLKRGSALRREMLAADQVPYAAHVAPHVVRTTFGDYVQTLRLGGRLSRPTTKCKKPGANFLALRRDWCNLVSAMSPHRRRGVVGDRGLLFAPARGMLSSTRTSGGPQPWKIRTICS